MDLERGGRFETRNVDLELIWNRKGGFGTRTGKVGLEHVKGGFGRGKVDSEQGKWIWKREGGFRTRKVDLEQGQGKWIWNGENGLGTGKVDLEQEKWIWNWEDRSFGTYLVTLESDDVDESYFVMLHSHLCSLRCSGSMNNDNNNIHVINILMMIKLKIGNREEYV